jgi:hypothetical protein
MSDQGSGSSVPTAGGTEKPGAAVPTRDWTVEVTDRVGSIVSTVRDKTTVPITKIARAVVFGVLAATLGVAALILLVITLLRVIDVYLPFDPYGRRVWVAYAALGAIFVAVGTFCWTKRTTSKP